MINMLSVFHYVKIFSTNEVIELIQTLSLQILGKIYVLKIFLQPVPLLWRQQHRNYPERLFTVWYI